MCIRDRLTTVSGTMALPSVMVTSLPLTMAEAVSSFEQMCIRDRFTDDVKIDLTLLPLELIDEYFTWDKLVKLLLSLIHI